MLAATKLPWMSHFHQVLPFTDGEMVWLTAESLAFSINAEWMLDLEKRKYLHTVDTVCCTRGLHVLQHGANLNSLKITFTCCDIHQTLTLTVNTTQCRHLIPANIRGSSLCIVISPQLIMDSQTWIIHRWARYSWNLSSKDNRLYDSGIALGRPPRSMNVQCEKKDWKWY